MTSVRRALGIVGPLSTQRTVPAPAPVEWSVSGHPLLVCPSTDHDSFKSNLPPAVFQASVLCIYKVDGLKPTATMSSVLNALIDDPKFSPHAVRRIWIAPVASFDDKPEPLKFSSRQLLMETDGEPVTLSARTLSRICEADKLGRCMGTLQSTDFCPWLGQMQCINNLIFKNSTLGSRRSKLRYQEWDKSAPVGKTPDQSTTSPATVRIGSLHLPSNVSAKGGAGPERRDSPPRSLSYRDATAGVGRRSFTTSPPPVPLPLQPCVLLVVVVACGIEAKLLVQEQWL